MTALQYRKDIQFLRGLSVIAVILFHAEERYFPLGYLGVDVFFVISGFVVTPLILRIFEDSTKTKWKRLHSLCDFYTRRFYRLAPALFIALIFSSILVFLLGPVSDHQRFSKQGMATLFLSGNIGAYKFLGDYFSPNPNPLLHTWSLSVEAQIFIWLPILLIILRIKLKKIRKATLGLLWGIGMLSIISFIFPGCLQPFYSLVGISSASQFSYYSPTSRFWQFAAGGILFLVSRPRIFLKRKYSISVLSNFALLICLFSSIHLNSKVGSIAATVFTIFVINFKSLELLPPTWKKVLLWFGDRSYSFYLLHMPLIYIAKYSPVFDLGTEGNRQLQTFIAILLTILIGKMIYTLIEIRFRGLKDRRNARNIYKFQVVMSFVVSLLMFIGIDMAGAKGIFRDTNAPIVNEVSPQDWDANCKFHQPAMPSRDRPCFYQIKKANRNFLLIGDSHAAHLSKTLIDIGKLNNANIYIFTYSACPFIIDKKILKQNFLFPLFNEGCLNHNRQILNFLNDVKIDVIFYTQRSTVPYVIPQTLINSSKLNSLVRSGLSKLEKYNSKLMFIGITPEYSSIDSVLLNIMGHEGKYLETPMFDNIFWKNEFAGTKTRYIEVWSKFCDGLMDCNNKIGNTWLFVDEDHLSQAGGELIKPEILTALK